MGYIYDSTFNRIGRVDSDGFIYDERLNRIGRIRDDGYGQLQCPRCGQLL